MYTLNITSKVHHEITDDWIQWQKGKNIPAMMDTGLFSKFHLSHLLDHDDEEGKTFILQFTIPSLDGYETFLQNHDDDFRQKAFHEWGDRFIAFRTLFETL
ncbi:MAG: DUF4286 family protein [Ginsengibacter sp.]